jgi:2-methylcitrate dehydratase PrpD
MRVHPLVLELTGKKTPQLGLEGKFSVFHSVAIAIIDGAAGEHQYSDSAVRDVKTTTLRDKVNATTDSAIKPDQVDMTITLKDGSKVHKFIEYAIGSIKMPMTDKQLEAKFTSLADGILPAAQTRALMDACWSIEQSPSTASIIKAAVQQV